MTIIRTINGQETLIELTYEECMATHEEWVKACDIEDLEVYAEEEVIDIPKKTLEAIQKKYRKILDWNIDIDDIKQDAAMTAIEEVLGRVKK